MSSSDLQESVKRRLALLLHGFDFIENYRPRWLTNPKTGYPLELDFWIPDANIGIEVQGRQHFEFIPFFHQNKVNFYAQQDRDAIKKEICKKRNITLFEITHPNEIDKLLNQIKEISKELYDWLDRRRSTLIWLSFYTAEVCRKLEDDNPNLSSLTSMIARIEDRTRSYNIQLNQIEPDFTLTRFQLGYIGKPLIQIELRDGNKKCIGRSDAVVMSIDEIEPLAVIRWPNPESYNQELHTEMEFDLRTGYQTVSADQLWWTDAETLKWRAREKGWKVP